MSEAQIVGEDWQNKFVPQLLGGLNLDANTESMQDNQFLQLNNLIYYKGNVEKDTGYADFGDVPSGVPGTLRNVHQHVTSSGTASTFAISDLTFYVLANSGANWHGVLLSGGGDSTIDINVSGTDVVIPIAATTNFTAGDRVAVEMDDGSHHISTIASVSAGISITIDDAVPGAGVVALFQNHRHHLHPQH